MDDKLEFDQDMLIGCIAPRIVSIGSASEDLWANPNAEFLSAKSASCVWEALGENGIIKKATWDIICVHESTIFHVTSGIDY